jgi:large subunit ribosomal protein L25
MGGLILVAKRRDAVGTGSSRRMRRAGKIPGVVYGETGSVPLYFEDRELRAVLRQVSGSAAIVTLEMGDGVRRQVLVADYQRHPLRDSLLHVDFHEVSLRRRMHAHVPVRIAGAEECVGVRQGGGHLEVLSHTVEVRCLPGNLPSEYRLDVSNLQVGQKLTIADLPRLEGVETVGHGDQVIVSCVAATVEAAAEETVADAAGEPAAPAVAAKG